MITPPSDNVALNPLPRLLKAANERAWRADAIAGLTVAVFAVPQAMAYAVLAGLPPVHGLYAAIVMSIFAALWGSSPFVNAGPTNTAALLTAAALAPLVTSGQVTALAGVFVLGVLAGAIRIIMGLLRMGWLVRFVPVPAFLGFIAAAELLIAFGQLHELLGVPVPTAALAPLRIIEVLIHIPQSDLRALALGLGTCGLLWLGGRYAKKLPMALIAALLAAFIAPWLERFFPDTQKVLLVRDIAAVPSSLPFLQLYFPSLEVWWAVLPGACAVAVIGLIEAVSIGQNLAHKHKNELNFNQEFFGQGMAQLGGALFGGVPGSGSFSRSSLLESNGAKTPYANIFFGIFTATVLLLTPRIIEQIPLAALAGLLFYTGLKMFNPAAIMQVWRTSRPDFAVLAITFLVTFAGKIEWGFFIGIIVAMVIFLSRARLLQIYELVPHPQSAGTRGIRFDEISYTPGSKHESSGLVALALHGDLFFGLAHELRTQLAEIHRLQNPQFIIIRTRRAHSVDYSCWKALFDFAELFRQNGGTLILTGVRQDLKTVIENAKMQHVFPEDCIVAPTESAWGAFECGLEQIAGDIQDRTTLSPQWQEYFEQHFPAPTQNSTIA